MRRRALWISVAMALLWGAAVGCERPGPPAATEVQSAREGRAVIPSSARALIELDRLKDALELGASIDPRLDPASRLGRYRDLLRTTLGADPWTAEAWTRWGVDPEGEARIFEDGGVWVLQVRMASTKEFEALCAEPVPSAEVQCQSWEDGLYRLGPADRAGASTYVRLGEREALVIPAIDAGGEGSEPPGQDAVRARLRRWTSLGRSERWAQQPWARRFERELEGRAMRVVVRPATWLEATGEGQKGRPTGLSLDRLRRELGPIAAGVDFDAARREVKVRMLLSGPGDEADNPPGLGGASGTIPRLGGLVDAGVLGVVRLSADPRLVWAYARGLLDPERQGELDALIASYRDDLAVDLEAKVLENLRGHAVIVVYGLEKDALDEPDADLFRDLFTLRATREAVLLPIADRDAMEDILNIATQLSRGKLHRKSSGGDLQYAWIDTDGLEWALMLNDRYLLVVDSSAAFDHAVRFTRGPRPLSAGLRSRGVETVLKGEEGAGVYLDARSLTHLLDESGHGANARWVRPFSSILLRSEGSRIELTLGLGEL